MNTINNAVLNNLFSVCPEIKLLNIRLLGPHDTMLYNMPRFWALNIYDYDAEVILDGNAFQVRRGYICLMPPGTTRRFKLKELSLHRVAHFRLPGASGNTKYPPIIFDSGTKREYFISRFDQTVRNHATFQNKARSFFWTLLWELTELRTAENFPQLDIVHPELERAVMLIEKNLSAPLKIEDIVKTSGLSHNQLIRLFQQRFKCSIIGYVRSRRATLAENLLRNTNMRIKEIAAEIDMPDLQRFNKFIREFFNCSPRQLRKHQ